MYNYITSIYYIYRFERNFGRLLLRPWSSSKANPCFSLLVCTDRERGGGGEGEEGGGGKGEEGGDGCSLGSSCDGCEGD